jgi:aminoglycoside 6'-N-acetyltransferase
VSRTRAVAEWSKICGIDELLGYQVALRPTTANDAEELRRIHATPAVLAWWGELVEGFPLTDEPSATRLTISLKDRIAGLIQFTEEPEADYRHASIDIFLDPELHGRGLGTDALVTLVRYLIDGRGHHRITIDPAVDNLAAVRSYEKAGFRRVGILHRAWRDPEGVWQDVLLMELVAGCT